MTKEIYNIKNLFDNPEALKITVKVLKNQLNLNHNKIYAALMKADEEYSKYLEEQKDAPEPEEPPKEEPPKPHNPHKTENSQVYVGTN